MRLFTNIFVGLVTLVGLQVSASPLKVIYQDIKLPTQRVLERQVFTAPIASNTTYLLLNANGPTSAAASTFSTFLHQPDIPRNLEILPKPATNLANCTVTVTGTDINNGAITERFIFTSASTAKKIGARAFKTVSQVSWPASCENSTFNVKWYVGVGEKLGLKRCMDNAGDIGWSEVAGAKEGTAPTMGAYVNQVSSNTADFNGTMNTSNSFILFYVQNYKCF